MKKTAPKSSSASSKKRRKRDENLVPHVVVSGYYGFDNLGDELILKVLTDELKEHGVKITVLSKNPAKTEQVYGVHAIHRMNFIDIVDALAQANLFISGGGGLFQDATGLMSPLYYGGLIHLAHSFEVPICFWAQGVGPLRNAISQKVTASALRHCDAIAVRDENSASLIEAISGLDAEITADPVWLLKLPKPKPKVKRTKKQPEPWRLGLSLRTWGALTESRLQALAQAFQDLAKQSDRPLEVLLLPFQQEEDMHLLQSFAKMLQARNLTSKFIDADQVLVEFQSCDALVGMRFHSLILGLLADIPVYGLAYDPKVATLLELFELPGIAIEQMESLTGQALLDAFAHHSKADLKPFKKEARRNFKILNTLLNIPEAELVR